MQGVTIETLDTLSAVARLGDATITLTMFSEQRPERMENYIKRGGPDPKVKRYTPRPGERMPLPHQDPFDEQAAIRRYYERNRFMMQKTARPTPVLTFECYRRGTATPIPSED